MTTVEGTWTALGMFAFGAALVILAALGTYLMLSWREDREERTRPERRMSVEETTAKARWRDSRSGLVFAIALVVVILALAAIGV
jgi:hypothetical protein